MRLLFLLPLAAVAFSQSSRREREPIDVYIKSHYTKYEFRIPMRDGKRLFTSVYSPKDKAQQYPFLIMRTPYSVSPYGTDQYKKSFSKSDKFVKEGFIFVFQD